MKIYLSPENRPKPHGPYAVGNTYEHDVCCEIAEYEKTELERCGFAVTVAEPTSTMAERCNEANKGKYNLYQTLHSNAGGGTGATCLYYGKVGGASYRANQMAYEELTKLYPSKRGIVDGTNYYENKNTKMVSVYPEIAFHDNEQDAAFILANKKQIAKALAKAICSYFGVAYVEESQSEETGPDQPAGKPGESSGNPDKPDGGPAEDGNPTEPENPDTDNPPANPPVGNDGARLYRVFQQMGAFESAENAQNFADGIYGNTLILWD